VVRSFIARRRAEQVRRLQAVPSVLVQLDLDRQFHSTATESLPADDWTRTKTEARVDCDSVDRCGAEKLSRNAFTESRPVNSAGIQSYSYCEQDRRAEDELLDEGDREYVNDSGVSSGDSCGPCTHADDAVTAALHDGVERPNLPFIYVFNGVVSRRAVLKVSTLFERTIVSQTRQSIAAEKKLEAGHSLCTRAIHAAHSIAFLHFVTL